jgi:predicted nucleic acid-binding protein
VNLVDSSGWIDFLTDGPLAGTFAKPICDTGTLHVPAVCLLEVYKIIKRRSGKEIAVEVAAQMNKGLLVPLDASLAIFAAEVGLQHARPLADSVILATAHRYRATLWTTAAHFKDLPGVKYLPKRRSG